MFLGVLMPWKNYGLARMTFRKIIPVRFILATCLGVVSPSFVMASAMEDMMTETRTKAETIYKILQFVTFPERSFNTADQPITVCMLGYDSFGKILEYVFKDKKIDGRSISIIRARQLKTLQETNQPYQVVYVSKSLQKEVPAVIGALMGRNCLVIGETPDFCQQGGMIQIKVLGQKARFDINATAVWQEDIKISSQLLKLASLVNSKPVVGQSQ